MTTCDNCIALKHFACEGKRGRSCGCNICGSTLLRDQRISRRSPRRKQEGPRHRPYQSVLTGHRATARTQYGVLSDFTPDQIELIFERKRTGGTISAIARELETTRDRVRTIYNAPTAPKGACPTCGRSD